MSHLAHFRDEFTWSDDPTNSDIALKDNGQGPIPPGSALLVFPYLQTNITSQVNHVDFKGEGNIA